MISLYDYAVMRYGRQIESAPFLTSVSAAFMDVGDIDMAEILKEKAFAIADDDHEHLIAFAKRFDAETRLE